jgi:hypothetical protein
MPANNDVLRLQKAAEHAQKAADEAHMNLQGITTDLKKVCGSNRGLIAALCL